jgi:hypothetical protein
MPLDPSVVSKALNASHESREIEFKSEFDPTQKRQWCELIKDIMAIANSGGGVIALGLNNDGTPSGADLSAVLRLDPAHITDKIHAYTEVDYDEFELRREMKDSKVVVCLILELSLVPILPIRPGTYEKEPRKQDSAFSSGVFYYRHGAKSEPGTTHDLEKVVNRNVREIRREWLSGVRRIATAPKGSVVTVHPRAVRVTSETDAQPVRITDNAEAPEFRLVDPDKTHPYRMVELLSILNQELGFLPKKVNAYDIRAVLEVYNLFNHVQFTYKPQFGSRKYSPEFAAWIKDNIMRDRYFLRVTRTKLRRTRRNRE